MRPGFRLEGAINPNPGTIRLAMTDAEQELARRLFLTERFGDAMAVSAIQTPPLFEELAFNLGKPENREMIMRAFEHGRGAAVNLQEADYFNEAEFLDAFSIETTARSSKTVVMPAGEYGPGSSSKCPPAFRVSPREFVHLVSRLRQRLDRIGGDGGRHER